jgi:hypothetical protein
LALVAARLQQRGDNPRDLIAVDVALLDQGTRQRLNRPPVPQQQRQCAGGNPNGARALKGKQVGNAEAVAKLKATATQRAGDLKAIVDDIRRSGITSVRGIAEELHVRGIRAPRGDTWHPTAVSRLLSRLSP